LAARAARRRRNLFRINPASRPPGQLSPKSRKSAKTGSTSPPLLRDIHAPFRNPDFIPWPCVRPARLRVVGGDPEFVRCEPRTGNPITVRSSIDDPASTFHSFAEGAAIIFDPGLHPERDRDGWTRRVIFPDVGEDLVLQSGWIEGKSFSCEGPPGAQICRTVTVRRYEAFDLRDRPGGELVATMGLGARFTPGDEGNHDGGVWVQTLRAEVKQLHGWIDRSQLRCRGFDWEAALERQWLSGQKPKS
jgi:hypothetical protein